MKTTSTSHPHAIATHEQWLSVRRELLREEKEHSRRGDALAARRRALPWVRLARDYRFESECGPVSLADLFGTRSQLIVYHFMLGPGWGEGCRSCSFVSDHFDGTLPHLGARDVALTAVSRAPLPEILAFKQRMGWRFDWVSSHGTPFNFDFRVSFTEAEVARGKAEYNYAEHEIPFEELPGLSVFARDPAGVVYHTYSTYGRGLDRIMNTYNLLDLVPQGRNEDPEATMNWVRYHDSYDTPVAAAS